LPKDLDEESKLARLSSDPEYQLIHAGLDFLSWARMLFCMVEDHRQAEKTGMLLQGIRSEMSRTAAWLFARTTW
jgi:hypothetical protein